MTSISQDRPFIRALVGIGIAATALVALAPAAQTAPKHQAVIPGCTPAVAGQPNGKQWPIEPAFTIDTTASHTAILDTTCGTVTISLAAAAAPRTVNSFVFLASQGYFDHTRCHRLTTGGIFVLQCGDPTATGMGGPGYKFADENLAGAVYPAGTVAMANAGPGTNGSQFFLVYRDTQLPPNYTPFGTITGGMDALTTVANAGVAGGGADGTPFADVVFNTVTTTQG
ncbi:peptidylprolyl isomerase [Nocardia alba]|uniref:Peptidyl-prolyl cis-trans isomerase n=1 Tax=Nocardia alba TaxID=225051 RepID=A0A4V2PAZ0_9NOCA|nr:peptidylprolyl isomerase [Nocardia alba]TCJ95405.1 peptidyl-prolyl cis-trans isomerase B (cyclophilin B) [Nocardia alba]